MNSSLLISLLRDPSLLKNVDAKTLEQIVNSYPYFQTAQLLLTKKYQLENHANFERQLNIAAAYAIDREKLFEWLQVESDVSIPEKEEELLTGMHEEFLLLNEKDEDTEFILQNKESGKEEKIRDEILPPAEARVMEILEEKQHEQEEYDQSQDFFLLNESGGNAEFVSSEELIPGEEKEELVREEDPEIESMEVIEEEYILRDLDFDFKEKEIGKISEVESPLQLESENTAAEKIRDEEFSEVESLTEIESEWAEQDDYDRTEDLLLSSENGSTSEFVFFEMDEDASDETPVSLISESQSLMLLESGEEPVADRKAKEISPDEEPGFRINEQVDSPGEFLPQKSYTFLEWLKFFNAEPKKETKKNILSSKNIAEKQKTEITIEPHIPEQDEKLKLAGIQSELETIDKIVSTMKQEVLKPEQEISPAELAKKSLELNEEMVSETLAQIYDQQGKYDKAIRMYARLSLKFPEKLSFFAARIKEIKSKK